MSDVCFQFFHLEHIRMVRAITYSFDKSSSITVSLSSATLLLFSFLQRKTRSRAREVRLRLWCSYWPTLGRITRSYPQQWHPNMETQNVNAFHSMFPCSICLCWTLWWFVWLQCPKQQRSKTQKNLLFTVIAKNTSHCLKQWPQTVAL